MDIYQLCPQCKGTGKDPTWSETPGAKCSWEGCKDGYVLWGKIANDKPVKAKRA